MKRGAGTRQCQGGVGRSAEELATGRVAAVLGSNGAIMKMIKGFRVNVKGRNEKGWCTNTKGQLVVSIARGTLIETLKCYDPVVGIPRK